MNNKLAIIAGRGDLPEQIISHCLENGRDYFIVALKGQTPEELCVGRPHGWTSFGTVGKTLKLLNEENIKEIVMVGGMDRPSLSDLSFDMMGMKWAAKIGKKILGDDSALKAVVGELEQEGFKIVGAESILKNISMPKGCLGTVSPTSDQVEDIKRAVNVLNALGAQDVGQGVVVQQGAVLAIEAIEGTEKMLARVKELMLPGTKGVLVKLSKPGQEQRVDLPTIGPETILQVAEAGLGGIVLEAGKGILLNQQEVIEKANSKGLFILGISSEEYAT